MCLTALLRWLVSSLRHDRREQGMVQVRLLAHDGSMWSLRAGEPVSIPVGGLSQLEADVERVVSTIPGVAGGRVDAVEIPPLSTSFDVQIKVSKRQFVEVQRAWWRAWRHDRTNTLLIKNGGVERRWECTGMVRGGLTGGENEHGYLRTSVGVHVDVPVWWGSSMSMSGTVDVVNAGVVECVPEVWWGPTGGTVTMPSGAVITLPVVDVPCVLRMQDMQLSVWEQSGEARPDVLRQLVRAWPETVPPGEERTYVLGGSAVVVWRTGVLSPWM